MTKTAATMLTLAYAAAFAYFGPLEIGLPSLGARAGAETSQQAPSFRLPGAKGGEIDLASYSGKPVMLLFFTESCPYCRIAGPAVEKLYREYGPKGLNVIGICLDNSPEAALNFARDLGVSFPLAYDGSDVAISYRARGVPYIYLLDARHKLYDVWEGYDGSYAPMLKSSVESLLAGK